MIKLQSDGKLWPFLSAATREVSERGKQLLIRIDNYEELANEHRWTSVQQKSHKILEWIRNGSSFFTEIIALNPATDYPLFDAVSSEECEALIHQLHERQLIHQGPNVPSKGWHLTMKGWEFVEPLRPGGTPGRGFVAMAFDAELESTYFEGIKPAVIEAGYEPICMKERLTNDNICDVILAEIRRAQFVVADFTKQKGGVYFEAGFASGQTLQTSSASLLLESSRNWVSDPLRSPKHESQPTDGGVPLTGAEDLTGDPITAHP